MRKLNSAKQVKTLTKQPNLLMLTKLCTLSLCLFSYSSQGAPGCIKTNPSGNIYFGNTSSIDISQNASSTSSNNIGLSCGGSLLNILGAPGFIRATVASSNNQKLTNINGDSIPYKIFATPQNQHEITPNTTINYYNHAILDLLGLLGSSYAPLPLFLNTVTGPLNLSAGTYTDTITVSWSWEVCTLIGILGLCIGTMNRGSTTWIGTLSLDIESDCLINAPDINFGSAPLASSFSPITQTISIYCTKGTNYSVGLSNGTHADGDLRRLSYNGHYLNYDIYQGNTGAIRWGINGGERRSSLTADINPGSGSGTNTRSQGFIYQAVILPDQPTPPAGVYTDTIMLDITF